MNCVQFRGVEKGKLATNFSGFSCKDFEDGSCFVSTQITKSFRPSSSKMNTTKTVCILSLEYHGNNDVSQASSTNTRITI